MSYTYEFPRPSVTATIIAFHMGSLLVATRSKHVEAYPGYLSLPGGFLNAKTEIYKGETVEQTAIREFQEECSVKLAEHQLELRRVISDPDIDPRAHVVNVCYRVQLNDRQVGHLMPGDDIEAIEFMTKYRVEMSLSSRWAFNHHTIGLSAFYS